MKRVLRLVVGEWIYEYATAWTVRSSNPLKVGTGVPSPREIALLHHFTGATDA